MAKREVIEEYPAMSNDNTTVIIIEGREGEKDVGGIDIEFRPFGGCCSSAAAVRLIGGIYRQVVGELEQTYSARFVWMSMMDAVGALGALEYELKLCSATGSTAMQRKAKAARDLITDIHEWLNENKVECSETERWIMRDDDPELYGHLGNPRAVVDKAKRIVKTQRLAQHFQGTVEALTEPKRERESEATLDAIQSE